MVGARVEGGNQFPSQYMEVLQTGADDGVRVEVRFGVGEVSASGGCGGGRNNERMKAEL